MRGVGMHGTIAEKIITYGGVGLVLLLLVSGLRQIINSCAEVTNMQELRKVAITFDDGPHPEYTPKLLDGLKERGVRATFFVTGDLHIQKAIDTVTMKGIEFLEQNNKWSKVYKGIKEFREFLPI